MDSTESNPVAGLALDDGELLIYDQSEPTAWIQSDDSVAVMNKR